MEEMEKRISDIAKTEGNESPDMKPVDEDNKDPNLLDIDKL